MARCSDGSSSAVVSLARSWPYPGICGAPPDASAKSRASVTSLRTNPLTSSTQDSFSCSVSGVSAMAASALSSQATLLGPSGGPEIGTRSDHGWLW